MHKETEALVVIEDDPDGYETVYVEVAGRILRGRVVRITTAPTVDYGPLIGPRLAIGAVSGLQRCYEASVSSLAAAWPFKIEPRALLGMAEARISEDA